MNTVIRNIIDEKINYPKYWNIFIGEILKFLDREITNLTEQIYKNINIHKKCDKLSKRNLLIDRLKLYSELEYILMSNPTSILENLDLSKYIDEIALEWLINKINLLEKEDK